MKLLLWTLRAFAVAASVVAVSTPAFSARLVRFVVPVPAGASTDFIARLMAAQFGLEGVDTVVENRPGASGMIGTEFASRQPPDGNTILITPATYLIDPQIRKAKYHPVNDFEPLCALAASPSVLVVPSSSPYRTLADLLNDAAARPGQLSVAALGPNSGSQLGVIALARKSNTQLTFVPYPGSAPAVTAVLGSHVSAAIAGYSVASEAIKGGHLRALAVAADSRVAPLPEVPTFAESGFPMVRLDNWFGAITPAKTPADTTNQLIGWLKKAIGTPEVKQKLEVQGLYPELTCGSNFAQLIRHRYEEYGEAIKQAGLKSE